VILVASRSVISDGLPSCCATTDTFAAGLRCGFARPFFTGEINASFHAWGVATNWRDPTLGLDTSPDGFGSPFRGSVNFAMADGSVRSLSKRIDPAVLKSLATPAGGEKVDPMDF
jgi:prepilin-type processing-associated H-X9-DG protein